MPSGGRGDSVLRYVVHRLLVMVPTLIAISIIVFIIIQLPPGDYLTTMLAELQSQGEGANQGQIAYLRELYGLDRPLWEQYLYWAWGFVQGDLGYSFEYDRPVAEVIGDRIFLTFVISFATILFTWVVVVPDRDLLGDPQIQRGRPRADLPGLPRPRHAELPAGPGPALRRQRLVRHLDRRAGRARISRPADELGQVRLRARAPVGAGAGDRHRRHRRHDPPPARQPARRAAEALLRHRQGQGPAALARRWPSTRCACRSTRSSPTSATSCPSSSRARPWWRWCCRCRPPARSWSEPCRPRTCTSPARS